MRRSLPLQSWAPQVSILRPGIARTLVLFASFIAALPFCSAQQAPAAQTPQPKRPMTFEDLMQMKRLGDTAVSPDGKWLAYLVSAVDLEKNPKTGDLWRQAISGVPDQG